MQDRNNPLRGRPIVESEAWNAILAVLRFFQSASLVRRESGEICAVIRSGESFELTSDADFSSDATMAVVDISGGVEVAKTVPEPIAALFQLYLPLCWQSEGFAVGHLGQSLDGRIATRNGASQFVTGPSDILHIHRMRALFDAIVVGAGTIAHDDPRLTTRLCDGENPTRVVIDTERRLDDSFKIFQKGSARTLVLCAADRLNGASQHGVAELVGVPRCGDGLSPQAIQEVLAARGLRRLYVEGGGVTVSRFLNAGCLDRLQVTVSPIIIGSGRPAITLPEVAKISDSLRPQTRRFDLGQDIMIECLFDA